MESKPNNKNPILSVFEKLFHRAKAENLVIIYKLLCDVLFLSLLFFALSLVAEGILPGIVTSHIGFPKIVIFVLLDLMAIYFLGASISAGKSNISVSNVKKNKKTVILLLLISILLLFNIQMKLNVYLNIFTSLFVILTGYFVYKILLEE